MRKLIFLILLFLSTSALAKGINVVEIANFYCAECFEANRITQRIEEAVVPSGGVFDFVPLFLDYPYVWPAKVYFSLPENVQLQKKAKDALFKAANISGISMKSAESACIIVQDAVPSYSLSNCDTGTCTFASTSGCCAKLYCQV